MISSLGKYYRLGVGFFVVAVLFSNTLLAQQTFVFGSSAWDLPHRVVSSLRPILNELQEDLTKITGTETKIQTKIFKNPQELFRSLAQGKIDFARLDIPGAMAVYRLNPHANFLAIETITTSKDCPYVFFTKEDGLKDISALAGKNLALGKKGNALEDQLPQWVLLRNLVLPRDLKSISYVDDPKTMVDLIETGRIHAGIMREDVFSGFLEKGKKLKVLSKYNGILESWVAREGIDATMLRAIQTDLLGMRLTSSVELLKRKGFVRGDFLDYEEVDQSMMVTPALASQGLEK